MSGFTYQQEGGCGGCYTVEKICNTNATDERVAQIEAERLEKFRRIEAEISVRRALQEKDRLFELERNRVR